jgi:lipopolysaccharide biosynthesis regulator YciM
MLSFFLFLIVVGGVLAAAVVLFRSRKGALADYQSLYYEGLHLLLAGNPQAAYQKFKDVVQENTDHVAAYVHLGNILRLQKNYAKALLIHRNLLMRPSLSTADKAVVLRSVAKDHLAAGDQENALAVLEELNALTPKDRWTLEQLLAVYEQTGKWDRAGETKKTLLKLDRHKDDALLALYKVQEGLELAHRDEHQARLRFRDALNLDPVCAAVYYHLGASYYREDRTDNAITEWKRLIAKVPAQAYLTFAPLGKTFYERGDFTETENLYRAILKTNPRDIHTLLALAEILDKKGDHAEAQGLCREALQVDPQRVDAYCKLLRYQKYNPAAIDETVRRMEGLCQAHKLFTCAGCGRQADEPFWHCPQCKQWQTMKL